jgi:hypothetical protein
MTDSIVRWHMMLYSFVMMRTRLTLAPGKKGAKKLLAQYGDQLVCVRYRYDAQKRRRYKTVELILAEREWEPTDPDPVDEVKVNLTIDARELALRTGWRIMEAPRACLGTSLRPGHCPRS